MGRKRYEMLKATEVKRTEIKLHSSAVWFYFIFGYLFSVIQFIAFALYKRLYERRTSAWKRSSPMLYKLHKFIKKQPYFNWKFVEFLANAAAFFETTVHQVLLRLITHCLPQRHLIDSRSEEGSSSWGNVNKFLIKRCFLVNLCNLCYRFNLWVYSKTSSLLRRWSQEVDSFRRPVFQLEQEENLSLSHNF